MYILWSINSRPRWFINKKLVDKIAIILDLESCGNGRQEQEQEKVDDEGIEKLLALLIQSLNE